MKKIKKGLAYLLSMALVIGGFYTSSLSAKAEDTANVSLIWAKFQEASDPIEHEIATVEQRPEGKDMYAKVINGGTYTEQQEDKGLYLYVNNAQVTNSVKNQNSLYYVRLAGNSSLQTSTFTVSSNTDVFPTFMKDVIAENLNDLISFFDSTAYTGGDDGQGGWNPPNPYSYEFTANTEWIDWTGMDTLTVNEGVTLTLNQSFNVEQKNVPAIIEVKQATINGTVSLPATTIEEPNAFVVLDGGSLTGSGKLEGSGNSYLEIRSGATVSGITLYDTDGTTEFTDFSHLESFHWEKDKWVRNNPGSGGEGGGPNLNKNQYRVFYDNRGGDSNISVLVNDTKVDSNATPSFEKDNELVFQLNPPEDRVNKTPVVAIYVHGVSETVYRTNPGDGEQEITLTEDNKGFSFTPTTDDPFEVFIDWSEYDAFGETEEKPIIVEVECEGTKECLAKANDIADADKMTDGNRMKVRLASGTNTITLSWTVDDPREIKVEGGSSYNNFTNKSQEIALPTTNENNTFYRVVLDFNEQGGGEGGNPGGEGGNGGEGGQSRPQSPDLVKANKGEIVINVSGPAQGGVLSYSIGDQNGYIEVQSDKLPLTLDASEFSQSVEVQIGFTTSGGYQFDDMQGNTIQIDNKAPTNIDLDQLGKHTFVVTYNPEEAVTIDIRTMESQPQRPPFDGSVYLFWEGEDGSVCKYKLENLSTSHKEGEGENAIDVYDVNFVKASDIADAAGDVFSITKKFEFVYPNMVDDSRTQHLFDGQLSENDKHAITMDPTNNTEGQTSVTWTPDREFRITFYEEGYQGICLVTSGMSYPEAPFNETVFGIKDKDIGGTTKENPAILPIYGLEQSITVTAGENSKPIKAITPLDVPNGAITVSEVETGKFNIAFHSNFYDKVVYQVTDENDKVYYVRIIRETLEAHDNFGPGMAESDMEITANFYFPTGNSYSEYQMVASLWVQDEKGQNVIKEVKVVQPGIVKDMDGASTGEYEVSIGATLKQSSYIVPVDKSIVAISFNIVKSGEMNSGIFSGAISGSGNGTYYDIDARRIIYDNVKEEQN